MCTLIWYLGFKLFCCCLFFCFLFSFFVFYCWVGCFSMIIWTPAVLSVLYACVLYFVSAPVQRSWACLTWKGVLEIRSSLLLLFSMQIRPWDKQTCYWDVQQPTNQPTKNFLLSPDVVLNGDDNAADGLVNAQTVDTSVYTQHLLTLVHPRTVLWKQENAMSVTPWEAVRL